VHKYYVGRWPNRHLAIWKVFLDRHLRVESLRIDNLEIVYVGSIGTSASNLKVQEDESSIIGGLDEGCRRLVSFRRIVFC